MTPATPTVSVSRSRAGRTTARPSPRRPRWRASTVRRARASKASASTLSLLRGEHGDGHAAGRAPDHRRHLHRPGQLPRQRRLRRGDGAGRPSPSRRPLPTITWARRPRSSTARRWARASSTPRPACRGPSPTPPPPAPSWAPGAHTLSVTFTPDRHHRLHTATATTTIAVTQATPTITWSAPAADRLRHGAGLGAARRHGQRAGDLRLHPGRRHHPGRRQPDPLGDLHAQPTPPTTRRRRRRPRSSSRRRRPRSPGPPRPRSSTARPWARASSTRPRTCRGPSPTPRPPAPSWRREPDALGHLHAHRHHRLHDGDGDDHASSSRQATPTITWSYAGARSSTGRRWARRSSTRPPTCRGPSPTPRPPAPSWGPAARRSRSTFTPTDTVDYTTATATTTIAVTPGHADDHLGAARRRSSTARRWARPSSTRPPACPGPSPTPRPPAPSWAPGAQTLSVTFTPTDTTDYTTATATTTITVTQATPTITWAYPGAIAYGTALGSGPARRHGQRAGDLRLHPGRRHASSVRGAPDALGHLHADRHRRLHDGDGDDHDHRHARPRPRSPGTAGADHLRDAAGPDQLDATASVPGTFAYYPGRRHRPGRRHARPSR